MFPFIDIDKTLDLEATADFLQERNDWIESASLNEKESSSMLVEADNNAISHNAISHWFKKGVSLTRVRPELFLILANTCSDPNYS